MRAAGIPVKADREVVREAVCEADCVREGGPLYGL
jgi:hypothetical protein